MDCRIDTFPCRAPEIVDLLIELALERENDSHMEKLLKRQLGKGASPTPERGEGKGHKTPPLGDKTIIYRRHKQNTNSHACSEMQ